MENTKESRLDLNNYGKWAHYNNLKILKEEDIKDKVDWWVEKAYMSTIDIEYAKVVVEANSIVKALLENPQLKI